MVVGYHPSSTCAMGAPNDANAVLVPRLNNGHTQMVAYGVGEGAAELIKEDARNCQAPAEQLSSLKLTPGEA
jgi:hypothetical protein